MIWEKASELTNRQHLLVLYGTNSLSDSIHFPEILTPEELAGAGRLRDQQQKNTWLCCRASLRLSLASLLNSSPQELKFMKNHFGKLSLRNSDLFFNVSHTKHAFLLAFNYNGRVGVDLELLDGSEDLPLLADYAFSEPEKRYCLHGRSPERFTEVWTRKEAFLKAAGVGLVNQLTAFSVLGDTNNAIDQFKLNQKSFLCPGEETGAIVYKGIQPVKFVSLI